MVDWRRFLPRPGHPAAGTFIATLKKRQEYSLPFFLRLLISYISL